MTVQAEVIELFWDWYDACALEMWEEGQVADLNEAAARRAEILGIAVPPDRDYLGRWVQRS